MTVVRLEGAGYVYDAALPIARRALRPISFSADAGERIALLGRSGSGKSTLAQIIAGVLSPTEGCLVYGDCGRVWASPVRLLFQFPEVQLFAATSLDDVAFGLRNVGVSEAESSGRAREALRLCRLDAEHDARSPWSLSDGERRRVALAGLLVLEPRMIVLDEPEVGLDRDGRSCLEEILASLAGRGTAVVVATHDATLAQRCAERALLLDEGALVYDGPLRELFASPARLAGAGIEPPGAAALLAALAARGWPVRSERIDPAEAGDEIVRAHLELTRRNRRGTEEAQGDG